MAERGFTETEAMQAVNASDGHWKQWKGTHRGWVYLFHKKHGNRTLAIVAELAKGSCYLVTGYWK